MRDILERRVDEKYTLKSSYLGTMPFRISFLLKTRLRANHIQLILKRCGNFVHAAILMSAYKYKELSRNKMHISDAGSIVQVKDENRRNTDVFQGLRTQNWAIETSQNAQIISRQFLRLLSFPFRTR